MVFRRTLILVITFVLLVGMLSFDNGFILGKGSSNSYSKISGNHYSGEGTLEDPYMIYDINDLQAINENLNAHYALANDIDASDTMSWNFGSGFQPLGPGPYDNNANYFKGSLDGRNHVISGLHINRLEEGQIGLFGCIDWTGTVKDLGLIDHNVTGGNHVGALVGYNEGTLSNTYADGNITGISTVGGLVGWNYWGEVKNSYAAGKTVGLCCGGGLIGGDSVGIIENSFYDKETTGRSDTGRGVGKTTSEMMTITTFEEADWDIIAVDDFNIRDTNFTWNIVNEKSYPFLSGMAVSMREYSLQIEVMGQGSTIPAPGTHIFTDGQEVRIDTISELEWVFSHWTDDEGLISKDDNIVITMDGDKFLTAHFTVREAINPPIVNIITPENEDIFDTWSIILEWVSEEGTYPIIHYKIRFNHGDWYNIGVLDSYLLENLEDGEHNVSLKVVDEMGNENISTVTFIVDTSNDEIPVDQELSEDQVADEGSLSLHWILLLVALFIMVTFFISKIYLK